MKIPIFIIVHNHYDMLKRSLASYEKFIDHPKQFVFHNTNSVYQPTLDFLEERRKKGDLVYHTNDNHHLTVRNTISDYLSKNPDCEYFVLTDPDVELQQSPGNIIDAYIYLINKYNRFCVGCWHRTDDIPDYYPLKSQVHKGYTNRYYNENQKIQEHFNGIDFSISIAPIDTTFQLIRSKNFSINERFPHVDCIRVFEPYNARHLDWYIDPSNLTDCQKFCRDNATNVSHWNNPNWKGCR
jgi:GT2 family glycosyltransferase